MDSNDEASNTTDLLRRQAEERAALAGTPPPHPLSEQDALRLVHELQVHQIELEMQNTELRQAREQLEGALEKYTDLYDFAPVGYVTLDHDGTVSEANLCAADLLGTVRSRLIGVRFAMHLAMAERPRFADFLLGILAGTGKQSIHLRTGQAPPRILQLEALVSASSQLCRVALLDISERTRAEDALAEKRRELEQLNDTLEQRIIDAILEMRDKDQLLIAQGRLAAMGEMINNIAHQWRQPLNSLGLLIQQLPYHYNDSDDSQKSIEEIVQKGMDLIQHMSRTIDDFRNFFRSDKHAVSFSVTMQIRRTLSLMEPSFKSQKINTVLQVDRDPVIHGYPNEYTQVLLNILINARDALVSRAVDEPCIHIRVSQQTTGSLVTIADTAGGIDPDIIDRIFDPYFTTKGPNQGTGIGLFMSKTIIERNMGGRLTVRNTDVGAEFRIEV